MTKTSRHIVRFAAVMLACASLSVAHAQEKSKIKFEAGNDNGSVEGAIKGDQYHDYILGAKAGQKMGVSLVTKGNAYFNIMPPGSTGEAIYNSSTDGNDATNVELPSNGDYTIRVYQMGNTSKTAKYTVSVSIMN